MNKKNSYKIVRDTLENSFNRSKFINFIKNLLNKIEEKSYHCTIPYHFENFIASIERVGEYSDGDNSIDILIIHLKKKSTIEKARSTQRNIIAHQLKKRSKDAALVAFVSPNIEDWRFSLVKIDYELTKTKKGKTKLNDKFSPARRWSFLVGKNESSHTAQSRLAQIIAKDDINPSLNDLEQAFNIETVTNEFFEKYQELYLKTKNALDVIIKCNSSVRKEFKEKKIISGDFAKKLLAQIIFLYFLQKKGWFGIKKGSNWGIGSKTFLRELFEKNCIHNNNNYFSCVLEYLFYDALRRDRRNKDDADYYPRFKCRIPFLNGGLFDPIENYDWKNLEIMLPNDLFSNNYKTKEGDVGNGILDIFDRYNFTVKEDEPLEKEVAIDPEMLGKVFENLLENDERKKQGAFYTPREIVHYMCQESLIKYLDSELSTKISRKTKNFKDDIEKLIRFGEEIKEKEAFIKNVKENGNYLLPSSIHSNAKLIDKALANIKICDPAVGSGAFIVGMMTEITKARNILSSYLTSKRRTLYHFKRECIQNSLYGVDIKSCAIEIAKLRLWLSLIVDEENIKEIQPLPNLEYKIVCGDSLLFYPYQHRKLNEIEMKKKSICNQTNPEIKKALKKDINKKFKDLFKNSKKTLGYNIEFDFKINFSQIFNNKKDGFDIVIANPPYVRHEKIQEYKPKLKYNSQSQIGYKVFCSTADLYTYFYELSYNILKTNGFSIFISSNKWMRAKYGEKLRKFFKYNTKACSLIDFAGHKVFDTATVDTNILMFQKTLPNKFDQMHFVNIESDFTGDNLSTYINKNKQTIEQEELQDSCWTLVDKNTLKIKEKMEAKGIPLKDWDVKINYGIKTGCNEAFIIDTATKERLCKEDPKSAKIIKPLLRGKDIGKYFYKKSDKFLLFIPWHFPLHNNNSIQGSSKLAEKKFKNQYPAIYKHLHAYKNQLSNRNKAETGIRYEWYALQRCANTYYLDFEKEKIVWQEIAETGSYHLDVNNHYLSNTGYILTGGTLRYLLALLNSKIIDYYFNLIASSLSEKGKRHTKQFVDQLPIPQISQKEQQPFINLVNKILSLTKSKDYASSPSKKQTVQYYQYEIDQMVYDLYGITSKEIQIIEEGSNKDLLKEDLA